MVPEWFYFAILSLLLISIVNIIDKILVSNYSITPSAFIMILGASSFMPIVTLPFFRMTSLPLHIVALTIIVGFIRIYYTLPYFKSLTIEEVSRVVPLLQLTPLFVLGLSSFVLNESLKAQNYVAFVLLVLGGTLFSIKPGKSLRVSMAFYLMIVSSFLFAVYSIALKYLYSFNDFYTIFIWVQVGSFAAFFQLFALKRFRNYLIQAYAASNKRIGAAITLEQIVAYISIACSNYAISLGPVALISALGSMQPLFVLLFATMLSLQFPHVLDERLTRTDVLLKGSGIIAIFAATYIINFVTI
ncbi:MAG TPA: EamA family transporter [Candidatus Acidoferrum sp.]|nr:EamA family transporter [Candidatus Acidoferrum sp.]